jgi:hypothetical protein
LDKNQVKDFTYFYIVLEKLRLDKYINLTSK